MISTISLLSILQVSYELTFGTMLHVLEASKVRKVSKVSTRISKVIGHGTMCVSEPVTV